MDRQDRFKGRLPSYLGPSKHQLLVLPFGLLMAPRKFTKTSAPLVQLFRTKGIRVHAYLDDWIIRADNLKLCIQHTQETIERLLSLGWTINWKKSVLEPSRILDFLGLHINLQQAIAPPPPPPNSFIKTLTSVLSRLSASTVISAHKVTSINSRISYYAPFIHHGRLQLRFLQFWMKTRWSQHSQPWDSQIQLDAEYLSHQRWFNRPAKLQVPLHAPEPSLFFFTDASLTGWGASWQEHQLSRQ